MQEAGSAAEPTPLCVYTEDGPASTQAGARHVTQEASSDKMDKMLTAGTSDADTRPLPVTEGPRGAQTNRPRCTLPPSCPTASAPKPHGGCSSHELRFIWGRGGVRQQETPGQNYRAKVSH